jgi:hypothetical protein
LLLLNLVKSDIVLLNSYDEHHNANERGGTITRDIAYGANWWSMNRSSMNCAALCAAMMLRMIMQHNYAAHELLLFKQQY